MSAMGLNGLTDQFKNSLTYTEPNNSTDINKPDFRELDLVGPTTTTSTATTTSSSSSSSGSFSGRNNPNPNNHSGELISGSSRFKPGHTRSRSDSHPLIYSGSSSVNSPVLNSFPTGNICPSGKIYKTGTPNKSSKTETFGSRTGNYGRGSIIRGGGEKTYSRSVFNDAEELKRIGNENYKKGNFVEALKFYDKAIGISPGNAAYHCNRAAALMGLKRVVEAVKECEEAIKLDPLYFRAHQRLGSLLLSLGQVDNARHHMCFQGHQPDQADLQKLRAVEKHIGRCTDARRVCDWWSTLREADAAIAVGADASPQLFACRAESLLKLHQLEDAELSLSNARKSESSTVGSQSKIFGMLSEAYVLFVQSQIELALGRFANALTAIERAGQIDPRSIEVSVLFNNVRLVGRARSRGNDLFKSERYTEACAAYWEGLRLDSSNSVLFCNRAACWYKLGQWEKSVDDCDQALRTQPNYTKALLRRAASYTKLERWAEAVRDYEALRKELPYDNEVAESLFHAQVALKKSCGEDVTNMKFGVEVELVSGLEQFHASISSPGASVVHFEAASNLKCKQISPLFYTLSIKYPSINFLKVDVDESPTIATAENVKTLPTFKIYKQGSCVKEVICPSREVLESLVRHYTI